MSMSRSRRSRVFTVSFPEDLASQVDELAQRESRNVSELFREAFRRYRLESMHRQLGAARSAARAQNPPTRHRAKDIEYLVDEVRAARKKKK
jgi:Arc/MetJ-type ribon-helix-helix transcriptional regulator